MKSKSLILMFVSLGFGLVAAIGISQVMGRGGGDGAPAITMGPVLVTVKSLEHNEELNDTNVKIENWPIEIIPETAARSLEQIENMAVLKRMSKGLPILTEDIINKNEVAKLPIPKGYKVVALPVAADDTLAGLLSPGDKVDVIGIFRVTRNGETRTTSKTFLKAITVFSVGNQMRNTGQRDGANNSSIVGVLLNEKQSEDIVLVQKEAQLKLALRGDDAEDEEATDTGFAGLGSMWDSEYANEKKPEESGDEPEYQQVSAGNPDAWTTKIWNGNTVETYSYQGVDSIPSMDTSQTVGPPIPRPSVPDPDDYEDYEQSESPDRDLEEDQYPGE